MLFSFHKFDRPFDVIGKCLHASFAKKIVLLNTCVVCIDAAGRRTVKELFAAITFIGYGHIRSLFPDGFLLRHFQKPAFYSAVPERLGLAVLLQGFPCGQAGADQGVGKSHAGFAEAAASSFVGAAGA